MARIYAGILGSLALVTTVARAVIHRGSLVEGLWAGCGWLVAFGAIGAVIGWMAERTIEEAVAGRLLAEMSAQEAGDEALPAPPASAE